MKKSFKITALLLIVLFLIQAFPMISAGKQEFSMPPEEEEEVLEEGLVKELKDLRTADSQTYLREDGKYETVIYSDDVFYPNEKGGYSRIDNSVIPCGYRKDGISYKYSNAANSTRVFFAEGKTPSVLIKAQDGEVSFSLIGANKVSAVIGEANGYKEIAEYTLSGRNFITYPDIYKNADIYLRREERAG